MGYCDKILKDKLQILQDRAARVITGARSVMTRLDQVIFCKA
jgi:hypothetical protein